MDSLRLTRCAFYILTSKLGITFFHVDTSYKTDYYFLLAVHRCFVSTAGPDTVRDFDFTGKFYTNHRNSYDRVSGLIGAFRGSKFYFRYIFLENWQKRRKRLNINGNNGFFLF